MRKLGTEEIAHIGEKVMLGRVRNLGGGQHEKYPTQQSSSPYTRFLPFCRLRTHHPQHLSLSLFTDCLCICICLCLCPFRFLSIKKITIKKEKERKKNASSLCWDSNDLNTHLLRVFVLMIY